MASANTEETDVSLADNQTVPSTEKSEPTAEDTADKEMGSEDATETEAKDNKSGEAGDSK